MKLLKKALHISVKKILAYPNEIYMVLLYSFLSMISTVIFWSILFSSIDSFGYSREFIYLLTMIVLISDGISEIFFGLRDMEDLVKKGGFDIYLYRPRNAIYLMLIERIPLMALCEKVLIGIIGMVIVIWHFHLHLSFWHILKGMGFLLAGVVYYQIVYGLITFLCLWTENISAVRNLIFQFSEGKKYPLTIFPNVLRLFLTYIIPMGLVAYYPTALILGLEQSLPNLYLAMPLVGAAAMIIYRTCMKKYASNGG